MYTHEILSKKHLDGRAIFKVHFTGGSADFDRDITPSSLDDLKAQIHYWETQGDANDLLLAAVSLGTLDLVRPTPTRDEQDKAHFFDLSVKLANLRRQVELGIIEPTDTVLVDLETEVKAAYKPEYFGL